MHEGARAHVLSRLRICPLLFLPLNLLLFVLSLSIIAFQTNADIILSEALVEYLATRTLNENNFYRADRYDCIELIPANLSAAAAQEHCSLHAIRHLYSWGLEW